MKYPNRAATALALFLALPLPALSEPREPSPAGAVDQRPPVSAQEAPQKKGAVKVELYTTSWCGYCKMAKKFMKEKNIAYTEYDVENDREALMRFRQMNPQGGVPFAIIGNAMISGYSEKAYAKALEDAAR